MTSTSSFPPVWQEIGNNKSQISGPLLTLPPSSLTPYQLSRFGADMLSSTKKLCVDERNLGASTRLPCNSSTLIAALEHQAPSLPSLRKTPAQQSCGDLPHRGNLAFGGNGVRRGENFWGSNNLGRGYNYRGCGLEGSMPF